MHCERCGGALAQVGELPTLMQCVRCAKSRVGAGHHTVPQCPSCFGDLAVIGRQLPITLMCRREGRFFYADFERGVVHPTVDPHPLEGFPPCPACGASMTFYEDLPPRATCPACDVDYSMAPLRPAPPCIECGGPVRILGDGAMPPQGDCLGCGIEAVLADAPEPIAPPIEITVQAVVHPPARSWWARLRALWKRD